MPPRQLGNECNSGLSCFLGGFCGTAGDSEGAPCDARVPCAAGWTCNGLFQCTKMDGKIGAGCDVWNPCTEGRCSLGFKCLEEGIALRESDIDMVFIYGYGWPRRLGGPMYWARHVRRGGLSGVARELIELGSSFGSGGAHWRPSARLLSEARLEASVSSRL